MSPRLIYDSYLWAVTIKWFIDESGSFDVNKNTLWEVLNRILINNKEFSRFIKHCYDIIYEWNPTKLEKLYESINFMINYIYKNWRFISIQLLDVLSQWYEERLSVSSLDKTSYSRFRNIIWYSDFLLHWLTILKSEVWFCVQNLLKDYDFNPSHISDFAGIVQREIEKTWKPKKLLRAQRWQIEIVNIWWSYFGVRSWGSETLIDMNTRKIVWIPDLDFEMDELIGLSNLINFIKNKYFWLRTYIKWKDPKTDFLFSMDWWKLNLTYNKLWNTKFLIMTSEQKIMIVEDIYKYLFSIPEHQKELFESLFLQYLNMMIPFDVFVVSRH